METAFYELTVSALYVVCVGVVTTDFWRGRSALFRSETNETNFWLSQPRRLKTARLWPDALLT